jgi:predicted DNA-binding transcriptional regulator AlpA
MKQTSRALSIAAFCQQYSIGRTTAYAEIKAGRLRLRKVGTKSLIVFEDAEAWINSLPLARATSSTPSKKPAILR